MIYSTLKPHQLQKCKTPLQNKTSPTPLDYKEDRLPLCCRRSIGFLIITPLPYCCTSSVQCTTAVTGGGHTVLRLKSTKGDGCSCYSLTIPGCYHGWPLCGVICDKDQFGCLLICWWIPVHWHAWSLQGRMGDWSLCHGLLYSLHTLGNRPIMDLLADLQVLCYVYSESGIKHCFAYSIYRLNKHLI